MSPPEERQNNRNDFVTELLAWRGDDLGGVKVPFAGRGGNPLLGGEGVVETKLVQKLRQLAEDLTRGKLEKGAAVFLIGGPGNGKSEAVDYFLRCLSRGSGIGDDSGDHLRQVLREKFMPAPLVPRVVKVEPEDLGAGGARFAEMVGRLVIIQDASATNDPGADATSLLLSELEDLARTEGRTVFLSCINRGVLSRAAAASAEASEPVKGLLQALVRASASVSRPSNAGETSCWPLAPDPGLENRKVMCWPMDMQSLLLAPSDGGLEESPFDQLFTAAVGSPAWSDPGTCASCAASELCPFRQNVEWLQRPEVRTALLKVLRLSELATHQRWNFRTAFSLVAELLVGDWDDFPGVVHPCDWVGERLEEMGRTEVPRSAIASLSVANRLFPHALYPGSKMGFMPEAARELAKRHRSPKSVTVVVSEWLANHHATGTYMRDLLTTEVAPRLDPAYASPPDMADPLRVLEDAFSVSVEFGSSRWNTDPRFASVRPSRVEQEVLHAFVYAEAEWDELDSESSKAADALSYLRAVAALYAKRSVGARLGMHSGGEQLEEYADVLHSDEKLRSVRGDLHRLLGDRDYKFDATATYGQPRSRDVMRVFIEASLPFSRIQAARKGGDANPAHDVPHVVVSRIPLPLTFELFEAAYKRRLGAPDGSIPASVQAAIDRIRHTHAGVTCRDRASFEAYESSYRIRGHGVLIPLDDGSIEVEGDKGNG